MSVNFINIMSYWLQTEYFPHKSMFQLPGAKKEFKKKYQFIPDRDNHNYTLLKNLWTEIGIWLCEYGNPKRYFYCFCFFIIYFLFPFTQYSTVNSHYLNLA